MEEWKNRVVGKSIKCPDCGEEAVARVTSLEHLESLLTGGRCASCGVALSCVKCSNKDCEKIVPLTENCVCCEKPLKPPLDKAQCVYPPCE